MTNKKLKCIKKITLLFFITIFFTTCASTKNTKSTSIAKVSTIENYILDNGIPVIIKQNSSNHILSLNITVLGGSELLTPDQSGLESALFTMMCKGSKNYNFETLQQIEYTKQSALSSSSSRLGSTLSLNCIDYYFEDMLPVFVDAFLHPAFGENEYNTMMNDFSQALQKELNNPFPLMQYTAVQSLYKGHPYETDASVTKESINNISIDTIKTLHNKEMDASRIFITAVGNFNSKQLITELNTSFGTISAITTSFIPSKIPELQIGGEPVVIENQTAAGSGYLGCIYPSPAYDGQDTIANILTANIYKDILFNIVREKHGACYSIGCGTGGDKAPYNILYVFKATDLENISEWIDEAKELLKTDKLIDSKDSQTGEYIYSTIQDRLEGYKNSYINSIFSATQTNQSLASLLINGKLKYNNPERYLSLIDRIRSVTVKDINNCITSYWTNNKHQWFVVTGSDDVSRLKLQ
jgi:zinc protease